MTVFRVEARKRSPSYYHTKLFGFSWALAFGVFSGGCDYFKSNDFNKLNKPITLLIDHEPTTLNPRRALEAVGQRLGSFVFEGLTRMDANLQASPGLASSWEPSGDGKRWTFHIRPRLKDHNGEPITAQSILACLENYRTGKPSSSVAAGFPRWVGTEASEDAVVLRLSAPDPYLPNNVSLLRYFRTRARTPCMEPGTDEPVWGSGPYRTGLTGPLKTLTPEGSMDLEPVPDGPWADRARLRFLFARDENSRALLLLRGDVDGIQNGLSLSKTDWFRREHKDLFNVLERAGVNVSYLAFNLKDPLLSKPEVRRALSLAIDRDHIVRHKNYGFLDVAGGFLSPLLPEGLDLKPGFDPAEAERLLDQAGYPRKIPGGMRLTLRYKTTPSQVGSEQALMLRDQFRKIGVDLKLEVQEQAVFFSSVKAGSFQLYSSRWIGVSDGSILMTALHSTQPRNRTGYKDPAMDQLLDQALSEQSLERRKKALEAVQRKMAEDLPYTPLWFWKNSLILRKGVGGLSSEEMSLSGGYDPLSKLKRTR